MTALTVTRRALAASVATIALGVGAASAQELVFPKGEGPFTWSSLEDFAASHDLSGQTLSITGTWTGFEGDRFNNVIAYFADATGAQVNYSGSDDFERNIVISAEANSAPNIAIFPQPGLIADMAARGLLTPLGDDVGDFMRETYAAGESWVGLSTFADENGEEQIMGLPYRVDVKSLVWYVPEQFEEAGYEVPDTFEDLQSLTEQMASDGVTPWCLGLGAGSATGWPATDWVEDMMLRTVSPDVYDQWTSHQIPFDDERVVNAINEYGWFLQDGFVNGGRSAAATTDYRNSVLGLFAFPPECYMLKQAAWVTTFFPEDSVAGEDYSFFYFPAMEGEDLGQPVLGGGTLVAITDPSEAADAFVDFIQTPIAHELWAAQGGYLTAHTGANLEVFESDSERELNDILLNATTFRFDGSDLMPGEIGAGAFWSEMVAFTTGSQDAETTAANIERRWQQLN